MSLLKCFKPVDKLPNTEQTGLPAEAISPANSAVERALECADVDRVKQKRSTLKHSQGRIALRLASMLLKRGYKGAEPL